MATATIVHTWTDAGSAYMAAAVEEGGAMGLVEYTVSTPLVDAEGVVLTQAQLQAGLTAALQAARAAQLAPATAALPISGTLAL